MNITPTQRTIRQGAGQYPFFSDHPAEDMQQPDEPPLFVSMKEVGLSTAVGDRAASWSL
jgi:hypothetical protein